MALSALKKINCPDQTIINNAINYLLNHQNTDGGYGFYSGDDSNVYMTAMVSLTLQQGPQTTSIASAVNKAIGYLIANQNADGGWGEGEASAAPTSTTFETAYTFMALVNSGVSDQQSAISIQNAIAFLTATQQTNGSWNDDPYSTALALRALANIKPNLTITSADITFSKPTPTVGDTITIIANIRNTGPSQADNVLIQFYDGDPAAGGMLIGERTISSIPAFGSSAQSISWTIQTTGAHRIFIIADPLNTIDELNETDNTASINVTAATPADLSITSADITISPSAPAIGDSVTISAIPRNKGETSAANVIVDFYDGNPASGGTLISKNVASSIGAGGTSYSQTSAILPAGEHNIYVVLDKENKVAESDKANNTAIKTFTVGAAVDLSVSQSGITFSPLNPKDGDIVTISAQIKNIASGRATNVKVRFYLGDPAAGGTKIGSDIILPEIQGASTVNASISWSSTGHAGNSNIYVVPKSSDSGLSDNL